MISRFYSRCGFFCLIVYLMSSFTTIDAQASKALKPFEPYIGSWKFGNTLQVFEWGVGKMSVIGKGYQLNGTNKKTLVAEGMWFWNPADEMIKGYVVAVNMPISFFDYTTKFENGKMINELIGYNSDNHAEFYREIMEIQTDSTYQWILFEDNRPVMEGLFKKILE